MLKQFRTARKLSQQEFAEIIGVPRSTYDSWERGYRKPSAENSKLLSGAIKRIQAYEVADAYYKALSRQEIKPRFSWKRKLLKLLVAFIITTIIVVLY